MNFREAYLHLGVLVPLRKSPYVALARVLKRLINADKDKLWKHPYLFNNHIIALEGVLQLKSDLDEMGLDDLLSFLDRLPLEIILNRYSAKRWV